MNFNQIRRETLIAQKIVLTKMAANFFAINSIHFLYRNCYNRKCEPIVKFYEVEKVLVPSI